MYDYNPFVVSTENMITYLEKTNFIQMKYLVDDKSLLEELETNEKKQQLGKLQKMSPAYVGQTINRVYGFSSSQRWQSAKIFNIVYSTIINEFLNINGLEKLFNEHYYDFEWDMHLEFDVETSTYNYYRDHMEHQVRNMYMMLKLLDDCGLIYEFKKLLSNPSISKISDYVTNRHKEFVDTQFHLTEGNLLFKKCAETFYCSEIKECLSGEESSTVFSKGIGQEILKYVLSFFEKKSLSLPKSELYQNITNFFNDNGGLNSPCDLSTEDIVNGLETCIKQIPENTLVKSYISDYSLAYIIRSASVISALFHDATYPLCFFMNIKRRIGQFLPSMNMFVHNTEADIDRIVSLLQSSLLFLLVSEKEIREKLSKNQEKYDHGVYSAIALLLSFYESGRINRLSIDKQIAIELAALAIYNHNFSYNIVKESAKEYYRPSFTQNPVSFLLKVCDEMQEWDRRYFELSKVDENIFCPNCGSPIIKYKEYENDKLIEKLICKCEDKKYTKSTFFPCRNMYTVTTCRDLNVISCRNNLIFKLNYRLIDLLHMAQVSCSYAAYRSKELNNLKVLMLNQKYSSEDSLMCIRNMYLDYTMSANPLYIKARILLDHIIMTLGFKKTDNYIAICKKIENIILMSVMGCYEEWKNCIDKAMTDIAFPSVDFVNSNLTFLVDKFAAIDDSSLSLLLCLIFKEYSKILIPKIKIIIESWTDKYVNDSITDEDEESKTQSINFASQDFESLLKKSIEDHYTKNFNTIILNYISNHFSGELSIDSSVQKKLRCYFRLAGHIACSLIGVGVVNRDDFLKDILSEYRSPSDDNSKRFMIIVESLMKDIYDNIISNQVNLYDDKIIDRRKYIHQYSSKSEIYQLIEQYINPMNWYASNPSEYKMFSNNNLDFHSDLLLFEVLGEKI